MVYDGPLRIEAAPLVRFCAFPQFWRQRIATAARPNCFDDPFPPVFDPFGMVIVQRDPIRELRRLDLFAEERRIEVEAHKLLVFGVAAGSPLGVGKRAVITGNTLGQVRDRLANSYSAVRHPHCKQPRACPIEGAFERKAVAQPDEKDTVALLGHPKISRS
jgi:hypothetical protein